MGGRVSFSFVKTINTVPLNFLERPARKDSELSRAIGPESRRPKNISQSLADYLQACTQYFSKILDKNKHLSIWRKYYEDAIRRTKKMSYHTLYGYDALDISYGMKGKEIIPPEKIYEEFKAEYERQFIEYLTENNCFHLVCKRLRSNA